MWHLREHQSAIRRLCFSPSGQHFASLDEAGTTLLWNLTAAPKPRRLFAPGDSIQPTTDVSFFPTGDRLLMCRSPVAPAGVGFWKLDAPDAFHPLATEVEGSPTLAFTSDGAKVFMLSRRPVNRAWMTSWVEGRELTTWRQTWRGVLGRYRTRGKVLIDATARALAFTSTAEGSVQLRDPVMMHYRGWWSPHPTSVRALHFRPDGSSLATLGPNQVRVWGLPDLSRSVHGLPPMLVELPRAEGPFFNTLAFSPDGTWLAVGRNGGLVQLFETSSWSEVGTFRWPIGNVHCLAFAPDGLRVAAAGERGAILVWDVE